MKDHYHVYLGKRRTTVSLSPILSALLALKLNTTPYTPEAYSAVQTWINKTLLENKDPGRIRVSQFLAGEACMEVAADNLRAAWNRWFEKDYDTPHSRGTKKNRPKQLY